MPRVARIVVIGSCNVDLTTFADRMPAPGETLFGSRFDLGFGGKGANQAVAARRCGAEVAMVARVGRDMFGESGPNDAILEKYGLTAAHIAREARALIGTKL